MSGTKLRLERPVTPPAPPPDRGRLLTAEEVAEMIGGGRRPSWARKYVPYKLTLGHSTVRWFEIDVRQYLERLRGCDDGDSSATSLAPSTER